MPSIRTWTSLILAGALAAGCGDDSQRPAQAPLAPAERAKFADAAVLAAMPVPGVLDEPRLRALLDAAPDAAATEYLSEDVLFEKDDARFFSMLMALVGSRNADVARLASDMVSGGYVVALSSGFDVGPAIDLALRSQSAATRRAVVRNLGLPECPPVRAWLKAHETDEEPDETDPAHATVASQAKASLARLNQIAATGESFAPHDAVSVFECDVGRSEQIPAPGAETTLKIGAADVRVGSLTRSATSPAEPVVAARVSLQMPNGIAIATLPLVDAKVFSFGCTPLRGTYILVWSRAVSRSRVRFWFRCKPPDGR